MITHCPDCQQHIRFSGADSGQLYTCPNCKAIHEYPHGPADPSPITNKLPSSLEPCRACKHHISPKAYACPSCGHPNNRDAVFYITLKVVYSLIIISLIPVVVMAVLYWLS